MLSKENVKISTFLDPFLNLYFHVFSSVLLRTFFFFYFSNFAAIYTYHFLLLSYFFLIFNDNSNRPCPSIFCICLPIRIKHTQSCTRVMLEFSVERFLSQNRNAAVKQSNIYKQYGRWNKCKVCRTESNYNPSLPINHFISLFKFNILLLYSSVNHRIIFVLSKFFISP